MLDWTYVWTILIPLAIGLAGNAYAGEIRKAIEFGPRAFGRQMRASHFNTLELAVWIDRSAYNLVLFVTRSLLDIVWTGILFGMVYLIALMIAQGFFKTSWPHSFSSLVIGLVIAEALKIRTVLKLLYNIESTKAEYQELKALRAVGAVQKQ